MLFVSENGSSSEKEPGCYRFLMHRAAYSIAADAARGQRGGQGEAVPCPIGKFAGTGRKALHNERVDVTLKELKGEIVTAVIRGGLEVMEIRSEVIKAADNISEL